jgi:hypothetical protein
MAEVTVSLKRLPPRDDQTCGVCGAPFTAEEDSGSRALGLKSGAQDFSFVFCGGCFSKWSHGTPMKVRSAPPTTA